jgi:hypothetical protein
MICGNEDFEKNTPHTYCYENNKWIPVGFAPSEAKMSGFQHRRRQDEKQNQISKMKSEHSPVEQKNTSQTIDNTANKYRTDEHRVIEWIRDCQQPAMDLMDDVPKLLGQPTLDFANGRKYIHIYFTARKPPPIPN